MAHEARDQVQADDASGFGPHQLGGDDIILLAQREQLRAHGAGKPGPVHQAEDDGDAEIDQQRAPGGRHDRG
ncbi:hypothetical protein D3C87_2118950 [compost metagenome]